MSVQDRIARLHDLREQTAMHPEARRAEAEALLLAIIDDLAPSPAVAKLIRATYNAACR